MIKIILLTSALLINSNAEGQATINNNTAGLGNYLGWAATVGVPLQIRHNANQPINIYTNSTLRAQFTTGSALTSILANTGDGLRLIDPSGGIAHLDLFASNTNGASETHVVWGQSGQISGQASRFEQYANLEGFFFNTIAGTGRYKFARSGTVTAFVGQNNFWRIGEQADASNFSGGRRLEVLDNTQQFRLTFAAANTIGGLSTDFFSNSLGDLQILPSNHKVGINLNADPTATIDVDGDARIRTVLAATPNSILIGVNVSSSSDVNVRRLDFTGNTNQVLLGNGTWGSYNLSTGFFGCSNTTTAANLTENSRINLNNYNLYFEKNDVLGTNHIGIGYSCSDLLKGKLSVRQVHPAVITVTGTETTAGYFLNEDNSSIYNTRFAGVQGHSRGTNLADQGVNIGGYFTAQNSTNSYGIASIAYGVGNYSFGIYSEASGSTNNYAGWFQGNLHCQGNITASGTITPSDSQFKLNIANLLNANDLLNALQPKTFNFDTLSFPDFNFEKDKQMGLIAQEVELVLPSIVSNVIRPARFDSAGVEIVPELAYKAVEYEELIPLLIAGHKEKTMVIDSLQNKINDLNDRLTQLENCLSGILPFLCQLSNSSIQQTPEMVQEQIRTAINVNLSDKNTIILDQNVPNPFAESTIITYSIPATVGKAQIHFYDLQGKLIKVVDINERGAGQLNVFGEDLSSGTYTYTLVADGQIVSTKKMVKE